MKKIIMCHFCDLTDSHSVSVSPCGSCSEILEMCRVLRTLTVCGYDCTLHGKNWSLYICLVPSKQRRVHQRRDIKLVRNNQKLN